MFLHLSPLVSLPVSLLRYSWPDAFILVSHLTTLVFHLFRPTLDTLGHALLHLSPLHLSLCLAPCLDTLGQTIAKLITTFVTFMVGLLNSTKHDKATCQYNSAYSVD